MVIGENMLQDFIEQNYLIIEQNIVTNVVVWNGDTTQWTPPQGSIALVQATTPALIWQPVIVNGKVTDYALTQEIGVGTIGFTWNGTECVTNEPKPVIPTISVQPTTTGTATA
jgi:hypothetical protein